MGLLDVVFQRQLVGLDIGVSSIKAVELTQGERPRLVAYNRIALPWETVMPDGEVRNPQVLVQALEKLFESTNFSTKKVAIGAAGNSVITRRISMPKMGKKELDHEIYWEAEQYIPFNINDVNLDYAVIGDSKSSDKPGEQVDILLVAAKKEYVSNFTACVQESGLIPEVVDIQAFALGNVFEFNYGAKIREAQANGVNVIIDFGAGSTKLSLIEKDRTTFTREISKCGNGCTMTMCEKLNMPVNDAETMKVHGPLSVEAKEVVHAYVDELVEEVSRTLDFCLTQAGIPAFDGIYTCGGASRTDGLMEALHKKVSAKLEELNPVQNVAGSGKRMNAEAIEEIKYLGAVAVGLSLRQSGDMND